MQVASLDKRPRETEMVGDLFVGENKEEEKQMKHTCYESTEKVKVRAMTEEVFEEHLKHRIQLDNSNKWGAWNGTFAEAYAPGNLYKGEQRDLEELNSDPQFLGAFPYYGDRSWLVFRDNSFFHSHLVMPVPKWELDQPHLL